MILFFPLSLSLRGVHVAVHHDVAVGGGSPLLHGVGGRPVYTAGKHWGVEAHLS